MSTPGVGATSKVTEFFSLNKSKVTIIPLILTNYIILINTIQYIFLFIILLAVMFGLFIVYTYLSSIDERQNGRVAEEQVQRGRAALGSGLVPWVCQAHEG